MENRGYAARTNKGGGGGRKRAQVEQRPCSGLLQCLVPTTDTLGQRCEDWRLEGERALARRHRTEQVAEEPGAHLTHAIRTRAEAVRGDLHATGGKEGGCVCVVLRELPAAPQCMCAHLRNVEARRVDTGPQRGRIG